MKTNVLSVETWDLLVATSLKAVEAGWATPGVFAPAVGPAYRSEGHGGLFYVGKAGGPLVDNVGLKNDYAESAAASTAWMLQRRNPSAFWQFVDLLEPNRTRLAWSNLAKIDTTTARPPDGQRWKQVEAACTRALSEELQALHPALTLFVTGSYQRTTICRLLQQLGYKQDPRNEQFEMFMVHPDGRVAAATRHPQGWPREPRDRAAKFLKTFLDPRRGKPAAA